jgi:uncharacterized protein (TIGR03000 family)
MRSRAAVAAVLLAAWPGAAGAMSCKIKYPKPPRDWHYHDLPGGPRLTYCYPFAGWPGYRGAYGGFWLLGPGPHRPVVPVFTPLPAAEPNPDPLHVPNKPHLGFGLGYYGWFGPYRASPRHLPYSVSVYPRPTGPMITTAPAAATATGPTPTAGASSLTVRVSIPPTAELLVDGVKTAQTGADRLFESPPVEPGRDIRYDLTARWVENGATVERIRTVSGKPGDTVRVDFTVPSPLPGPQ